MKLFVSRPRIGNHEAIVKRFLGASFLLVQVLSIVQSHRGEARWLAWAPNDYATWYQLQVRVNGRELAPGEIETRYQLPAQGVYQNPAQNIKDIVQQYGRTYGRKDDCRVILRYRVDGGPLQEWQWPEL